MGCIHQQAVRPGYDNTGCHAADECRLHELPTDHAVLVQTATAGFLFRDTAMGLSSAAAEKRDSLERGLPNGQRSSMRHRQKIISSFGNDLETERHAIQKALPESLAVWGFARPLEERERRIIGFSDGEPHPVDQADSGRFWLQFSAPLSQDDFYRHRVQVQ